jgi:superfamily I DNA and/or RNA helicase
MIIIVKYRLRRILSGPRNYDSFSLFEFCVNKLVQRMNDLRYPMDLENGNEALKSHIQWTNLIFGSGNDNNKQYLSKVKSDFGSYFINQGNKYKWNFQRILKEHPNFFYAEIAPSGVGSYSDMFKALEHEIIESKRDTQKNTYRVSDIQRIKLENGDKIYLAVLNIEEDEDPKLVEDLPITVRVGGLTFETKVLDYDKVKNSLYFQIENDISKYYGAIFIQVDASWILVKIKERLKASQDENTVGELVSRFINGKTNPKKLKVVQNNFKPAIDSFDDSQLQAYSHALINDISIIWGPPGTGKSHTLAGIIDTFYKKREKTLVTCIANVAVDSITIKLIELLQKQNLLIEQGEILRIGHTRDKKLLETAYLFPDNRATKLIRERILDIDSNLQNAKKGHELGLKKERQDLREKLKKEVSALTENSIITFSTASKFFIDSILNSKEYDNLIIDEASMVSIPHFIALGLNIKKRIIITGDFRQLGPVVLSQSEASKKWLYRDIFEFSGINTRNSTVEHSALKQLLIQRRSHELICNLINSPFYQGKLKSDTNLDNDEIVHVEPFKGRIVVYKSLKKDNRVEFTKRGSRLNKHSASEVLRILDGYSIQELNSTIGIITPYRGQVKLLQEQINTRNYPDNFKSLIKVGTIHAFQGSECDLIIFDTVDSIEESVGKLYRFEIGKRLVNVALSRARYKLIVCGDLDVFIQGKGHNNIDLSLNNIFRILKNYEVEN